MVESDVVDIGWIVFFTLVVATFFGVLINFCTASTLKCPLARRERFSSVRKSIPRAEKNKPSLLASVRILFSRQREAGKRPYVTEPHSGEIFS